MSKILVTGGAGYIGSHMCVELLEAGFDVVVVDNYSNSSKLALEAVQNITGRTLQAYEADLRDKHALETLFAAHEFEAVLHFAGLKAVGESVSNPLSYYDNNVVGTQRLLEVMQSRGVRTLVFSSSATVYGIPEEMPIDEGQPTEPINPYGRTKLHIEGVLQDVAASDPAWRVSLLRYFNPVGAHPSGKIGETPRGTPNNLMPYISQVAVGKRTHLNVFGNDYGTPDGTGIRDYIHVVDLVRGHLAALDFLKKKTGVHVHNLGAGRGYSVLEMISAFEEASGCEIPYEVVERRPGDAAISFADPDKARSELNWSAEYNLQDMCGDSWRWQCTHPAGFVD